VFFQAFYLAFYLYFPKPRGFVVRVKGFILRGFPKFDNLLSGLVAFARLLVLKLKALLAMV